MGRLTETEVNTELTSDTTSERAEKISKSSSKDSFDFDTLDGQLQAPQNSNPGVKKADENLIPHTDNDSAHETNKLSICCATCSKPLLTKYNALPVEPSRAERFKHSLLCPPHGCLGRFLTITIALVLIWAVLWSITGSEALPGHSFFGLFILFVCCIIGGAVVERIKLPALLGMLILGCLLRNVPYINVGKDIDKDWSSAIRNIALVVILTRAGLGLDPKVLKKLSFVVLRLAFIPCIIEAVVVAITTYLLLDLPWVWGFMLGFVLAAVSPAVVVPSMLHLEEKGLGTDKGIPTLVIAAASVDDVLAISGFGVFLGIAFSKSNLALTIFRGPLEALLGVVYGILMGLLAWYLPHRKNTHLKLYRFIFLFCGGLFAVFGSISGEVPGAGALGCLTLAFVAAIGWRQRDGWSDEFNPMADIMAVLWMIFQPFLFGLIGNEIVIETLDGGTVGLGIATLCVGLAFRVVASFLAVLGTDLTWKERFFIPFAWLPKATVQAAIGPQALDAARQFGKGPKDVEYIMGLKILTIAVLVILITAPLGSALIALLGPRFLTQTSSKTAKSDDAAVSKEEDDSDDIESNEISIEMSTYRARPSGASMPDEAFFRKLQAIGQSDDESDNKPVVMTINNHISIDEASDESHVAA
ncbi:sodium/hydrogen exchanger 9B2-like [Tubulanus polymorphus]|uniref:sodium/hydrogen exchanger 9B2-like n=1 Tax=Tubulanus polymorphus TaxID=672921 RepID=UPI003DA39D89